METLNDMFDLVILQNELGGNMAAALEFSDPDGVLSGKSGWSFAPCQFDLSNNDTAALCLAECGFNRVQIEALKNQSMPTAMVHLLEPKLKANAATVIRYSTEQLSYCLNKALNFDTDEGIPVESPGGILASADYVNQYGSQGNGARDYYRSLGRPITAEDVLAFKLEHTKYGREHPADCRRRYDNIIKVVKEASDGTLG
jgi:hypothetical protein